MKLFKKVLANIRNVVFTEASTAN